MISIILNLVSSYLYEQLFSSLHHIGVILWSVFFSGLMLKIVLRQRDKKIETIDQKLQTLKITEKIKDDIAQVENYLKDDDLIKSGIIEYLSSGVKNADTNTFYREYIRIVFRLCDVLRLRPPKKEHYSWQSDATWTTGKSLHWNAFETEFAEFKAKSFDIITRLENSQKSKARKLSEGIAAFLRRDRKPNPSA